MEDRIKNKLKDLNVKWDKESLWEKMEPQLRQPNNNWQKYVLLCLGLFTVLAIGLWSYQSNDENIYATDEIKNVQPEIIAAKNKDELKEISTEIKTEEKIDKEKDHNKSVKIEHDQTKYAQSNKPFGISSIAESETTADYLSSEIFNKQTSEFKINPGDSESLPRWQKSSESSIPSQILTINKSGKASIDIDLPFLPTEKNIQTNLNFTSVPDDRAQFDSANSAATQIPDLNIAVLKKIEPMSLLAQLPMNTEVVPGQERVPDKFDLISSTEPHILSNFYLELSHAFGKSFRKVSISNPDEPLQLQNEKFKQFEKPLYQTSSKGNLGYRFSPWGFVTAGVSMESIHELVDWQRSINNSSAQIDNYENAFYELNENGDSTFYAGPALVIYNTNQELVHYNCLRFFTIPVSLGYQRSFGRMELALSAGVNFSFASKFKGKVVGLDVEGQPFVEVDPTLSISKVLGWQGELSSSYLLNRRTAVLFSIGFKNNGELTMKNVQLSYQVLQGSFGIRRYLN